MSSSVPAITQRLAPARAALTAWWQGLGPRERRGVQLAVVVLGVALLWMVALGPAARTLRTAPAERERLERQLQEMQALASEAKGLRAVAPVSPDQARTALQAAVGRLQDRGKLSLQGQRGVLTLKNVGSAELGAFLAEARAGARARVIEATLTQASPGLYDGTLTVSIGGGAP